MKESSHSHTEKNFTDYALLIQTLRRVEKIGTLSSALWELYLCLRYKGTLRNLARMGKPGLEDQLAKASAR